MADFWDKEFDLGGPTGISKSSDRFDHIRDQLSPNAPDGHVYEAYAAEAKDRIASYKSHHHMTRWWLKSAGALLELAEYCPFIWEDLNTAYSNRLHELVNRI